MKLKNRRTYVVAVVLWLLNVFDLFHSFSHLRVGG